MNHRSAAFGALLCAASVATGAFGAHAIADMVSAERLATWQTAARYLGNQGLGILLLSLFSFPGLKLARRLISIGVLIFSIALFILVISNSSWLGAVAPVGGTLMIAGWITAAVTFFRFKKPEIP